MIGKDGLTLKEAKRLLEKYGKNELPRGKRVSNLKIMLAQLKSPLIYVLLFAAIVTFFLQDFTDTAVIAAAVVINTLLGFYQERKAERALESLKEYLHPTATVVRDGKRQEIAVEEIVPGDVVVLAAGERVPADGALVESHSLTVNEAILTGESVPVVKKAEDGAFMGTTIICGRGVMVVQKTGAGTQMGKIATSLREQKEEKTPLQAKLGELARWLAIMVGVIAAVVFVTGVLAQRDVLEMFTVGVAVAVAAIPEGLIVALTVILAIGMQRIFKRKGLVRKLLAAETLGSVTVVASDKTGTLTLGQMSVSKTNFTDKKEAVRAMQYANVHEDPLELAIDDWLKKNSKIKNQNSKSEKIRETPFDPERKYQSATVKDKDGNVKTYISGAPEVVLAKCKLAKKEKAEWEERIEKWASGGLRIVGLAEDSKWLGLVGIEDPVREEVVHTLEKMHNAGIRLKIITGDYLGTAVAVWEKIKGKSKVLQAAYKDEKYVVGADLSDVEGTAIFARVSPQEKLQLVKALQEAGEVVAIFGDGVNDAPALKAGDIGVVVNEAADTAKETADIVLLDSNFKTVAAAIEEGRGIYDNIKKVLLYLLSDSFSEIILILLALAAGLFFDLPLPLTAAQILWINLITDGFPNLALTVEPKEENLLRRKPEDPHAGLLTDEIKMLIATISGVTGIVSFLLFLWFLGQTGDVVLARTVVFAALGVDSLLYVFSVRSLTKPIWKTPFLSNPYLLLAVVAGIVLQLAALYLPFFNTFLNTVPLGVGEWSVVLAAAALVIVLIELIKYSYTSKKHV